MARSVVGTLSYRLRSPVAALLCLAAAQLLLLATASCDGEPMPMGAVRVHIAP